MLRVRVANVRRHVALHHNAGGKVLVAPALGVHDVTPRRTRETTTLTVAAAMRAVQVAAAMRITAAAAAASPGGSIVVEACTAAMRGGEVGRRSGGVHGGRHDGSPLAAVSH